MSVPKLGRGLPSMRSTLRRAKNSTPAVTSLPVLPRLPVLRSRTDGYISEGLTEHCTPSGCTWSTNAQQDRFSGQDVLRVRVGCFNSTDQVLDLDGLGN